ncbi:MAG: HIT domain-containing protein [bacterium]
MDRLYAPWRSSYITEEKTTECPFCVAVASVQDESHFVLSRTQDVLVLLNKYPYNAGHLLVVPTVHCGALDGLTPAIRSAMMEAATEWSGMLQQALSCHGFNIGFNLGTVSGGSIPDHIHLHVLPRWSGDTNFLATLGDTKLVSFNLQDVYSRLRRRSHQD